MSVGVAEKPQPDVQPITRRELDALEKILDQLYAQLGLDIEYTKHFLDRVNDPRNGTQITIAELAAMFTKEFSQHGDKLANLDTGDEGLLTDLMSNINSPFVVKYNRETKELELVMKTVMRKRGFKTSTKIYSVK